MGLEERVRGAFQSLNVGLAKKLTNRLKILKYEHIETAMYGASSASVLLYSLTIENSIVRMVGLAYASYLGVKALCKDIRETVTRAGTNIRYQGIQESAQQGLNSLGYTVGLGCTLASVPIMMAMGKTDPLEYVAGIALGLGVMTNFGANSIVRYRMNRRKLIRRG